MVHWLTSIHPRGVFKCGGTEMEKILMGTFFDIVINAEFAAHVWSLPLGTRKKKMSH
jgi:hypothetical protein